MQSNKKGNKGAAKTARGYRLSSSTHQMITKLQEIMNCSKDKVITDACKKLYNELNLSKVSQSANAA
jgi:hypothetical protein